MNETKQELLDKRQELEERIDRIKKNSPADSKPTSQNRPHNWKTAMSC